MTSKFDLIIKNGRIIDGTGNPWYNADIGVVGGGITAILPRGDAGKAEQVIDASGMVVSPGFIDTHSHDDAYVIIDPQCSQKVLQGVTTTVMGNCGFSLTPITDGRCSEWKKASSLMGGNLLDDDFWSLRSFAQYLEKLDTVQLGINVVPLVGHGTIRVAVMGFEDRAPTESEMTAMKTMTTEAMQAGAFGLSTGLIYVPANYAKTEEVIELARVAAQFGGLYATHMRSEGDHEMEAIQEVLKIARAADIAVHIAHHKVAGRKNWGNSKLTLQAFSDARRDGLTVSWDQYPYRAGGTMLPAALPPHIQAEGAEAYAKKLQDPAIRNKIKQEIESADNRSWENLIKGAGFENIFISVAPRHPDFVGKSIAAIAETHSRDPYDIYFDLVVEEQMEAGIIIFMMGDEDIERILKDPGTMIGSDGVPSFGNSKPHPRMTGTFPRILGRYARDKGVITLEDAIRKMTSLPAQTFRLHKKGIVRPGMDADLVVFDPQTIIDKSTFKDPLQSPEGIGWVIVNGEIAAEKGTITGATSGKVMRSCLNG
jgi:N-acyl-D-amino-acid deacylase